MSAIYFILGAVAKANSTLWRLRINFVPINLIVVGVMVAFGVTSVGSALEGMHNAKDPTPMTLIQIRDARELTQNFVTVSGLDFPIAVFEYGTKGAGGTVTKVETSYSPLVDREHNRILLVQKTGKLEGGDPHEATITGMLRDMDGDLRLSLLKESNVIEGVPVEGRYVLVAGERPAGSTTDAIWAALLFGIVALVAIAQVMRNTVFQPTGGIPTETSSMNPEPIRVRGSGSFFFEESVTPIRKWFVNMAAVLVRLENGHNALASNIDASSRFMGFTTSKRAGIWTLEIESGSVHEPQVGFQYWGTSRQPAVRFEYTDTIGRTRRTAVIAVDNEAALGAVVGLIGRGTG